MPQRFAQYGGAAGADQVLQQIIAEKLAETQRQQALTQQQTENAQKNRQIAVQEQSAQSLATDRTDRLAETAHNNQVTGALRLAPLLKPGQDVASPDAANFQAAGMGSLLKEQPPQLPSTTMMGTGGGALRTTSNPAKPAGYEFTGTQTQADQEAKLAGQEATLAEKKRYDTLQNEVAQARVEAAANKPDHSVDTRMDRSYQFHRGALDKLAAPLEQQAQRMGRLIETVNQHTPQADALVAPELLTVMAGGAGSGLRMNEAEIQRIVGGRSNFESIKAALNKWQMNPTAALSITEPQRAQIRNLIAAVHDKSQAQLAVVNKAGDALIDAPDVVSHRRILGDARRQLQASAETTSGGGGGGAAPLKAVNPTTGEVRYSDDGGKTWRK